MDFDKKIVLKDGREFYGKGFGASASGVFELVFDTAMVGYQEVISDPSNYNQMILPTFFPSNDFSSHGGKSVLRVFLFFKSNCRFFWIPGPARSRVGALSGLAVGLGIFSTRFSPVYPVSHV